MAELDSAVLNFKPDIMHLHGLWVNHGDFIVSSRRNIPIILSPRGMLDPWALSVKKWKKRLAMALYQRRDLKIVSAFHATAELEAGNIRGQGLTQPIIISPNGVEVPDFRDGIYQSLRSMARMQESRTALFVGRLHPGKGLISLAEAWSRVMPENWTMRVVGPDRYGHKREIMAKLDELGVSYSAVDSREYDNCTNVGKKRTTWEFVDAVDDQAKWLEYAAADVLVHPSVSENFGISIAEGLAAGLPVVCTKGTPWRDIEEYRCGYWIDQGIEALAQAISVVVNLSPAERMVVGARGQSLINRKYTWPTVAKRLLDGYEALISRR